MTPLKNHSRNKLTRPRLATVAALLCTAAVSQKAVAKILITDDLPRINPWLAAGVLLSLVVVMALRKGGSDSASQAVFPQPEPLGEIREDAEGWIEFDGPALRQTLESAAGGFPDRRSAGLEPLRIATLPGSAGSDPYVSWLNDPELIQAAARGFLNVCEGLGRDLGVRGRLLLEIGDEVTLTAAWPAEGAFALLASLSRDHPELRFRNQGEWAELSFVLAARKSAAPAGWKPGAPRSEWMESLLRSA